MQENVIQIKGAKNHVLKKDYFCNPGNAFLKIIHF